MADVVDYSRLMGEGEAATLQTLSVYQGIMADLINQHRGRVVDAPGDALLAEFSSVVDAVQCAVAVQKELEASTQSCPRGNHNEEIGLNSKETVSPAILFM